MSTKVVKGSFVAIIAMDNQPYFNDDRLSEEVRNMEVPTVLMINRGDGKIGFPGGTIDGEETPLEAVLRECLEEIDSDLSYDVLEYMGEFKHVDERIDLTTHLFVCFIPSDEFEDIRDAIVPNSEITGYVTMPIANHRKGGYSEFLKNNFPLTAKEQLEELVAKYNLLKEL